MIDTKEEEILYLREIIHKLNSELSRCQNINNSDNQKMNDNSKDNNVGKKN